jgi:hypothetical protein
MVGGIQVIGKPKKKKKKPSRGGIQVVGKPKPKPKKKGGIQVVGKPIKKKKPTPSVRVQVVGKPKLKEPTPREEALQMSIADPAKRQLPPQTQLPETVPPLEPEKQQKRGFLETLLKGPELPEGTEVRAGTLPIAPGGVTVTKTVARVLERERSIQNIQNQFKIGRASAEKIWSNVARSTPEKLMKILTAKPVIITAGAVAGASTIAVWLASDNILTGTTFTMRKLKDAVKEGRATRDEADEILSEMQGWIDIATMAVNINSAVNPVLWPFRNLYMLNARKAQVDFDLDSVAIDSLFEGLAGAQEEESLQQRLEENRRLALEARQRKTTVGVT